MNKNKMKKYIGHLIYKTIGQIAFHQAIEWRRKKMIQKRGINMTTLKQILEERPKFHTGETELPLAKKFSIEGTQLSPEMAKKLIDGQKACYGLSDDVLLYLSTVIAKGHRTLETGAGLSTLIFALNGAEHVCITPNQSEVTAIRHYAEEKQIDLCGITFVVECSDRFLPVHNYSCLDLVLIDGKHAFPWPIIDWFYTADALKQGGLMVIDDVDIAPIRILCDFMTEDPRWKLHKHFGEKTFFFEKIAENIHDVAWHMQPYITSRHFQRKTCIEWILSKIRCAFTSTSRSKRVLKGT